MYRWLEIAIETVFAIERLCWHEKFETHFVSDWINVREHRMLSNKSRETDNIGYTRRKQEKQLHSTICVGHQYTQTNTNNVNKTWSGG